MCLIVFAWHADPRYRLVLAANRDEMFERPSAAADYWHDEPNVLGGRDLEQGGSWLALDRNGRWAAVTNFRDGGGKPHAAQSRGALVSEYVASASHPAAYIQTLGPRRDRYSGFNLLVADQETLFYVSNRGPGAKSIVDRGIHGLSNHLLDTPWPKVQRARRCLEALLAGSETALVDGLFDLLLDRRQAQEHELPTTGVSPDWERALSSVFISAGNYGTRASTVMLIGTDGSVQLEERGFGPKATEIHRRRFQFMVRTDAAVMAR